MTTDNISIKCHIGIKRFADKYFTITCDAYQKTNMEKCDGYHCVEDFHKEAKRLLNKTSYDYLRGPANDGITYVDNEDAFKRYKFRPKVLRDVSRRDLSTSLLGEKIDLPIGITPFGLAKLFNPKGEVALVRANERVQTCYIQSHWSSCSVEEVHTASPTSLKWIQVYIYKNRKITSQLLKRAKNLGYKAVVLTVDVPVLGRRLADLNNAFRFEDLGENCPYEQEVTKHNSSNNEYNLLYDESLTFKDISWIKQQTKLPVVVKGILTCDDAREAVTHGADAIMVSNHGGRQLDGVPATVDVLSEIVREVEGKCEVYLDGGVRSGTDVLKALVLGAKAVFIGRPAAWGLTCAGEDGVVKVLDILKKELDIAMALCGNISYSDFLLIDIINVLKLCLFLRPSVTSGTLFFIWLNKL